MTRVWPIDALNGRDILAEWMLTHPDGRQMMIRLWDGNQCVSLYFADALPLPTEADSSTDYPHGFRQVVDEILPGHTAAGWVLAEAFLADGIDAADAEFSPVSCLSCGFGHPWWNGAEESCHICDTATDLEWLPHDAGLNGLIETGEYDSARSLLRDLSHTLATGKRLLTDLPEGKQRTNIEALMGPARAAYRGATVRLRAALALPNVAAATEAAEPAVLAVIAHGTDVAEWLARLLARVAAQLGSVDAVTANRPGSWEADLVHQLVGGTVGLEEDLVYFLPATAPGDDGKDQDDDAEALLPWERELLADSADPTPEQEAANLAELKLTEAHHDAEHDMATCPECRDQWEAEQAEDAEYGAEIDAAVESTGHLPDYSDAAGGNEGAHR